MDLPLAEERESESTGAVEAIASTGISPRLWRLYAYFWLGSLFFPILYLIRTPLTTVNLLIAVAGLAIFVVSYSWVMWPDPLSEKGRASSGIRASYLLLIGMILMILFLSITYGSAFSWLFLGVSAMIGVMLPPKRAFWAVMGLTLLTLIVYVISSGGIAGTDWLHTIPLVLLVRVLGLDIAGLNRLAEALWELNAARRELARQAVMEERLRMARDLHDLLGHTLSLITLKSELARRLIEKSSPQAVQEVTDIERVARHSLREVRETLTGYRQRTLASELDGARRILEAAGINCRIKQDTGTLPSRLDVIIAWTIREGVTNVIRHSRAEECLIRIDSGDEILRTEVINDGYRGPDALANVTGTGLAGLAERVAEHGGDIHAGPFPVESRPGFRLLVELPIQNNLARKDGQQR
jgi:two-component system sensor histidine kinase DesK